MSLRYSRAARRRFAQLAGELDQLRQHTGEPVLDLSRRVIVTLGLDVEVMATPEFDRSGRRDQLGTFFDAVADYVDVDGDASLAGLLAYLQAEIDTGAGLEQAVPSDREAVKLLTVHQAKGLEWPVVFLPALMHGVFPSDRVTDNWVTNPAVLPAELRGDADAIPQLAETTNTAMGTYKAALRDQQLLAEDRLAYVAATRAKRLLVGIGTLLACGGWPTRGDRRTTSRRSWPRPSGRAGSATRLRRRRPVNPAGAGHRPALAGTARCGGDRSSHRGRCRGRGRAVRLHAVPGRSSVPDRRAAAGRSEVAAGGMRTWIGCSPS